jgi:hypothetical protein
MPKLNPVFEMISYGRYTPLEKDSRELPHILEFTRRIPAGPDIEFGFILRVLKGKGCMLDFRIDHPPFKEKGIIMPPFTGQIPIKSSDYKVFLGDALWPPYQNKKGIWIVTAWWEGTEIESQSFDVY